ncbi:MAG: serine/threonine protein kinase [Gemmatimonadaceae bacterium]|nr:serine/threonine protein kinase [Gemmatimonadaceae bacterium]
MPPATRDALAQLLAGQYDVERELGRGGMAVVFLATDTRLDRLVAIKVLEPTSDSGDTLRARFVREARTAAQLSHPNIVPVYQAGEVGEYAFFVMGFIDGETLGERIKRLGALSPAEVVRLLREAAWALAYAHARGVVHRDVKPDNLMLEKSTQRLIVTDFGIARDPSADRLTRDDHVMGSVHFMSPEQIAGEALDGRSDLYALGVVGFLALTGRLPFEAATASAVIVQHATQPAPPIGSIAPDVPPAIARVIDRCLAKRADDRYPDGEAFAHALTQALEADAVRVSGPQLPNRAVTEGEARAIWQRAAELQAEAATRIQQRYRAEVGTVASTATATPTPSGGYRLRDVEQAAVEAGIGAEFVALALSEQRTEGGVAPAVSTAREERTWTQMMGTDRRTIVVTRDSHASPRELLAMIGRTLPAEPFSLVLRDTIGGHPLDGGVLVFDIPKVITGQMVPSGRFSPFQLRMYQIELWQLKLTLRALPQGGTRVECTGDLRPGLRKNWLISKVIAGLSATGGVFGGGTIGIVVTKALVGALAPAVVGGALVAATALAWYRVLYRSALEQATTELTEMLRRIDADRRTRELFGFDGRDPRALRGAPPPADDPLR